MEMLARHSITNQIQYRDNASLPYRVYFESRHLLIALRSNSPSGHFFLKLLRAEISENFGFFAGPLDLKGRATVAQQLVAVCGP
jgi:hypothetical protein